jgi:hypothetical protein
LEAFPPEIHGSHPSAYTTIKMPGPRGVITLKSD